MTAGEVRIRLEELGGALRLVDGQLQIANPRGGLPADLRQALEQHRQAIAAHVARYPCTGCGRTAGMTPLKCARCASLLAVETRRAIRG